METNKIIITGGSTRIGAAIAKKLSGAGVEIVIHYKSSKLKAEILNSRLTKEEKNLKEKLSNDINSQLITLRIEIGTIESQVVQNTSVYGSNHGAVIELNEKLNS